MTVRTFWLVIYLLLGLAGYGYGISFAVTNNLNHGIWCLIFFSLCNSKEANNMRKSLPWDAVNMIVNKFIKQEKR